MYEYIFSQKHFMFFNVKDLNNLKLKYVRKNMTILKSGNVINHLLFPNIGI